jgi:hypothetical protein
MEIRENLGPNQKKIYCAAMMRGLAQAIVYDIDVAAVADMDALLLLYDVRFLPNAAGELALVNYETCRQEQTESVRIYHSRIRQLYLLAHPGGNIDIRQLSRQFRIGLYNHQIASAVTRANATTYQEALDAAETEQSILIEAVRRMQTTRQPQQHFPSQQLALDQEVPMDCSSIQPDSRVMAAVNSGDIGMLSDPAILAMQPRGGSLTSDWRSKNKDATKPARFCFFCKTETHDTNYCNALTKAAKHFAERSESREARQSRPPSNSGRPAIQQTNPPANAAKSSGTGGNYWRNRRRGGNNNSSSSTNTSGNAFRKPPGPQINALENQNGSSSDHRMAASEPNGGDF